MRVLGFEVHTPGSCHGWENMNKGIVMQETFSKWRMGSRWDFCTNTSCISSRTAMGAIPSSHMWWQIRRRSSVVTLAPWCAWVSFTSQTSTWKPSSIHSQGNLLNCLKALLSAPGNAPVLLFYFRSLIWAARRIFPDSVLQRWEPGNHIPGRDRQPLEGLGYANLQV